MTNDRPNNDLHGETLVRYWLEKAQEALESAKSDRIGADRIDLLNQGDAIPLGLCNSNIRFSPKAPPTQC